MRQVVVLDLVKCLLLVGVYLQTVVDARASIRSDHFGLEIFYDGFPQGFDNTF